MARTTNVTRKLQIYNFILAYKSQHDGNSPSIREITDACGITSTSVTNYYLDKLKLAGLIVIEKGTGRGAGRRNAIEVVGGKWTPPTVRLSKADARKLLPVVTGRITTN